jgi:protocatechuate 3,4-dioxygenase beta subunit
MKKIKLFLACLFVSLAFHSLQAQDSANVVEEVPFDYLSRNPIYDYDITTLSNTDTIPDYNSQESKLKITGIIYKSDGITPANDVILFISHQNEEGYYDMKTANDKRYINHRGWIKTDADGKYTFYTFIPGSYPHSKEARHIHATIKEAGKTEYKLNGFLFDDDPFLSKTCRKRLAKKGVDNILTTLKKDNIYVANHDIVLK